MPIHDRAARRPRLGVSATEAAKSFGRLVDRVRAEQAVYAIERGGVAVAQIGPLTQAASCSVTQFKAIAASLSRPDAEYLDAVERAVARHNKPRARRDPWAR